MAEFVKQIEALDDRIAMPSKNNPMYLEEKNKSEFKHKNFYPAKNGMRNFCLKAEKYLKKIGVNVCLDVSIEMMEAVNGKVSINCLPNEAIEADHCLWTLSLPILESLLYDKATLKDSIHQVPMVLIYFLIDFDQLGNYSYIHDYTPEHIIFRPGAIAAQTGYKNEKGQTYVCFEITTGKETDIWKNPANYIEKVWQEGIALDMVRGNRPKDHLIKHLPTTFSPGKINHGALSEKLTNKIFSDFGDTLKISDQRVFSKFDIKNSVTQLVN
jgi:protoporphyrinogen oxidase